MKRSGLPQHTHKFKQLQSIVNQEITKSYWKYIESIVSIAPGEKPKRFYSYLKSLKKDSSSITALKSQGETHTDPREKAQILNKQFHSVFAVDPPGPIPQKGPSPYPKMKPIRVCLSGVTKLLKSLKPHKASGPDEIGARVLKELHDDIAPILTTIFHHSLKTGQVPNDWKQANVAPVYKKGDRYAAENYRPVSLTSICCKLLEHIIVSNMMSHFEEHHILNDCQHGFRSKRSCETQLIGMVHDLATNLDKRNRTDLIILDFSKAFDKASHQRLLYKLQYYGIHGNLHQWISNFLGNRTQRVVLDGATSDEISVTSGVPQGTVLGPILFLAYINDLPECLKYSKVRLFADDAIVYKTIKCPEDQYKLQSDIHNLEKWETDWLMHFNPSKCNTMHVTRSTHTPLFKYKLHGIALETVTEAKYLGVTLHHKLSWNPHVHNATKKANSCLGMIRRNLKPAPPHIKQQAYFTLVRPHLEYASCVWDPFCRHNINQVEMVQRRAARFVCNRYHNTSSVSDMISNLSWQSLETRRQIARTAMLYKALHGLVNLPTDNTYLPKSTRSTRNSNPHTFIPYSTSTDSLKYSFYPRTITNWNRLPTTVVTAPSVDSFKEAAGRALANM